MAQIWIRKSRKLAPFVPGSISPKLGACPAGRTRIHIDGVPLHIVQRGHGRAACFFDSKAAVSE
jgi:hypothetical protein